MADYQPETQIIIGIFISLFIIKFFFSLYKRKNAIILSVDNCIGCPFKRELDGDKLRCDLNNIIGKKDMSHKSHSDLKEQCPIKGKIEILIMKQ